MMKDLTKQEHKFGSVPATPMSRDNLLSVTSTDGRAHGQIARACFPSAQRGSGGRPIARAVLVFGKGYLTSYLPFHESVSILYGSPPRSKRKKAVFRRGSS